MDVNSAYASDGREMEASTLFRISEMAGQSVVVVTVVVVVVVAT